MHGTIDNNSPSEDVHNIKSGTLRQWIGKEKKYMHAHFNADTYSKHGTTTHHLRMYITLIGTL